MATTTPANASDEYKDEIRDIVDSTTWGLVMDEVGVTAEVQSVFDNLTSLTSAEQAAISVFVNGLVRDGLWDLMDEFYCPCLNATDYLKGFKGDVLTATGSNTHTTGSWLTVPSGSYLTEGRDFDSYNNGYGAVGGYFSYVGSEPTINWDFWGVNTTTEDNRARWKGSLGTPVQAPWYNSEATTAYEIFVAPTGDVYSIGRALYAEFFEMVAGGVISKTSRAMTGVPANLPFIWNGRNNNGTPAASAVDCRWSCMYQMSSIVSEQSVALRLRILTLLTALGVPGAPTS